VVEAAGCSPKPLSCSSFRVLSQRTSPASLIERHGQVTTFSTFDVADAVSRGPAFPTDTFFWKHIILVNIG
jgi:hypothetical protein